MDEIRSITSMVMIALLVCGGIIGSAIAATAFAGTSMERYGTVGFFASLALGAVLVVLYLGRLLRGGRRR